MFCVIRIASDRPYRGKDYPKKTDYFDVIAFGKLGQSLYNNLASLASCLSKGRFGAFLLSDMKSV